MGDEEQEGAEGDGPSNGSIPAQFRQKQPRATVFLESILSHPSKLTLFEPKNEGVEINVPFHNR